MRWLRSDNIIYSVILLSVTIKIAQSRIDDRFDIILNRPGSFPVIFFLSILANSKGTVYNSVLKLALVPEGAIRSRSNWERRKGESID
jgi:hypothetical protein